MAAYTALEDLEDRLRQMVAEHAKEAESARGKGSGRRRGSSRGGPRSGRGKGVGGQKLRGVRCGGVGAKGEERAMPSKDSLREQWWRRKEKKMDKQRQ